MDFDNADVCVHDGLRIFFDKTHPIFGISQSAGFACRHFRRIAFGARMAARRLRRQDGEAYIYGIFHRSGYGLERTFVCRNGFPRTHFCT